MSGPDEDIRARVRELEHARIAHGERLAEVRGDVNIALELARAVAPVVRDLAHVRDQATTTATEHKAVVEDVQELKQWRKDHEQERKGDRYRRLSVAITIVMAIIGMAGLIFVILQFSGVGHG